MAEIRVKAIQKGYYGNQIREEGAEFIITDEKHFSKKWMARAGGKAKGGNPEGNE